MKKLRINSSWLLAAALAAFMAPAACRADNLSLVFTPATQSTAPGGTVSFTGTITNTSNSTIFLNGDSFTGLSSFLSVDDTPFFTNVPASLAAGAKFPVTGNTALLDVTLSPSATLGQSYTGIFNILGGTTASAQSVQGNAQFTVIAAASVPEASTTLSLGLMLLAGAGALTVKTRKRAK